MGNNRNDQSTQDNDYVFNFYTSGSEEGVRNPNSSHNKGFSLDGSNYNLNGLNSSNQGSGVNYGTSNASYGENNSAYGTAQGAYAQYAAPFVGTNSEAKVQNTLAKTFAFMFAVLLVTALSAYMTVHSRAIYEITNSSTWWIFIVAELATVFIAQFAMKKNKVVLSAVMLMAYSIVNGITLSVIFLVYDLGSIVTMFVLASVIFGVLAIFGLVTKKDLSALGSVGIMTLVAVIMLSLVNVFAKSSGLSLALAAVGLAVFIGLTAYDVQKIKALARTNTNQSTTVLAMFGALMLYLDLINIFLYLLRLFGRSND